jgi:hypothetical protein
VVSGSLGGASYCVGFHRLSIEALRRLGVVLAEPLGELLGVPSSPEDGLCALKVAGMVILPTVVAVRASAFGGPAKHLHSEEDGRHGIKEPTPASARRSRLDTIFRNPAARRTSISGPERGVAAPQPPTAPNGPAAHLVRTPDLRRTPESSSMP